MKKITGPELQELVSRVRATGIERFDARTTELMSMELEPSTWKGRATHMKAICNFMVQQGLDFPLAERHLVAFMGFSYSCLQRGTGPQLSSRSMASYIAGIRRTHAALGLGLLPQTADSLHLRAATEGYKKAASSSLPSGPVRIALPVHVLYMILQFGSARGAQPPDIRDASMIVTAAVFGLRPAGVQSLRCEQVEFSPGQIRILVESLKGRTLQQAQRRGARSFFAAPPVAGHPLTVLALLDRWAELRGAEPGRWFERAGMPAASLDAAVKRLTNALGWEAPRGCQVSGHSLRILAFSQSSLLSWSAPRMQVRFDWKRVEDMGEIYMDHLARTSAASLVFFSPHLPEPTGLVGDCEPGAAGLTSDRPPGALEAQAARSTGSSVPEAYSCQEPAGISPSRPEEGNPAAGSSENDGSAEGAARPRPWWEWYWAGREGALEMGREPGRGGEAGRG